MGLIATPSDGLSFYTKVILIAFTCAHYTTGLLMVFFLMDYPLGLTGSQTPEETIGQVATRGFGVRQAAIATPMLLAYLLNDKKAAIAALGGFCTRCYLDVVACALSGFPLAPIVGDAFGATFGSIAYPASFTTTGTLAAYAIYVTVKY